MNIKEILSKCDHTLLAQTSTWEEIKAIVREELPSSSQLETLLLRLGAPTTLEEIGQTSEQFPAIFHATRDIRDKYVLSRLCWDLGLTGEFPV